MTHSYIGYKDDGKHRHGDLFAAAPAHRNLEDLIDQANDRETWRTHVNSLRPTGEKQRIANMTRAPDADDDLNYFAVATRTTEEQRQDRQLRFTKRHGQPAPPPIGRTYKKPRELHTHIGATLRYL